ncbi:hypothetical protein [Mycolicibacterium thermoresistibile]
MRTPLAAANLLDGTEPLVEIPQPPGWAPSTTTEDPYARLVLENPAMAVDGVIPTAVVNLAVAEIEPGPGVSSATAAENMLETRTRSRAVDLQLSGTSLRSRSTRHDPLCGFPALRRAYTVIPNDPSTPPHRVSEVDAVLDVDGRPFLLHVAVRGPETDDEAYRLDTDRILRGVQIRSQR